MEGEKADEARKILAKAANKALRTVTAKPKLAVLVSPEPVAIPESIGEEIA